MTSYQAIFVVVGVDTDSVSEVGSLLGMSDVIEALRSSTAYEPTRAQCYTGS